MTRASEILDAYRLHRRLCERSYEQKSDAPVLAQDEIMERIKGMQSGEILTVYLGGDDGQE